MYASKLSLVRPALIAALGLAAIAGSTGARAELVRSIEVSYSDLDLSNAKDVSRLNTRVQSAVNRVCAANGERGVAVRQIVLRCKAQTLAKADSDVQLALAEHGNQRLASRQSIGVAAR